jgi:hypothetical protein
VIKNFLQNINQKSEHQRNRWALGLTITFSILIFLSFVFYKGYLNFGIKNIMSNQKTGNNVAAVVSAKSVPSPIESTKETFRAAFGEIHDQYQKFQDSVSGVLVPFFTSIEVYERK